MKKLVDNDVIDFLPDALSIRNARLPWWAASGVKWMLAFFLLMLLWAWVGRVDVIVQAQGRLISDHPTIAMKPLERTVVKEVRVRVGDRVKAGQILATFDPVFSKADMERLAAEVELYEAQFARLEAESADRPYVLSEKPSDAALWQRSIFLRRQAFHAEKLEYFARELERIAKTRRSLEDNLVLQRERLAGYGDIERMYKKAIGTQAVSLRSLREVELTRMQLEADISDKEHNILVLDSESQARAAERDAFRAEWKIKTVEEMVRVKEALTAARKEYDKALQMTSYVVLRAPEDAVVHDIAPLSMGSAVREVEPLITLVPLGGTLEVEAEVRAEDIGRIREGNTVRVKVTPFPFQKYGTLSGEVRVISADAFQREGEQGGTFYRARIAITGAEDRAAAIRDRLVPGMETLSEIRVGERRIIEYLIHPIIRSLDEAIREP